MEGDELTIDSKDGSYVLKGNATVVKGGRKFSADRITYGKLDNKKEYVIATGNVKFTDKDLKITSDSCEGNSEMITFKDKVVLENNRLGTVRADQAEYNPQSKIVNITAKKAVKLTLSESKAKEVNREAR
jgi:lipopolysaccharide export system protein LptA